MKNIMFTVLLITISSVISLRHAVCQTTSPKYEVGTITAVVPHQGAAPDSDGGGDRFDVSVRVRNKIYTALYTSPDSLNSVKYHVGGDVLVLIGSDTLTFSNKFSDKTTAIPILKIESLPERSAIDWSKAPSQYVSMKMQNLTERLDLSEEQQNKIKPIADQESGEVSGVCFTPTIPRKERLERFEKIVRSSDAKLRPILSQSQWAKLQQLRKEQKQELKNLPSENN